MNDIEGTRLSVTCHHKYLILESFAPVDLTWGAFFIARNVCTSYASQHHGWRSSLLIGVDCRKISLDRGELTWSGTRLRQSIWPHTAMCRWILDFVVLPQLFTRFSSWKNVARTCFSIFKDIDQKVIIQTPWTYTHEQKYTDQGLLDKTHFSSMHVNATWNWALQSKLRAL